MNAPSIAAASAGRSFASPFRPRLTYAIAPPNTTTPPARRRQIADEHSARISSLPIDALLVYDVQDEAARTGKARPFAYIPKVDALEYAYADLKLGALPRVVYRAVTNQNETSMRLWLDNMEALGGHAVLVGPTCRKVSAALTLSEAYQLARSHAADVLVGGVLIPERHERSGNEDGRVWAKMQQGCRFFVSQTVWSVAAAKRLLGDLRVRCELEGVEVPPIVLTLSPCGSRQTLDFLEWLGVAVPTPVKRELLTATDMLTRSVELALDIFAELRDFASEQGLGIGCNVESVTVRPAEVDASLELLHRIARVDSRAQARNLAVRNDSLGL
jgi:hypothetical protein